MDFDVVVIGGGPAGLAAATWLGRYRRQTLVVDSEEYRNRFTTLTHGYLGRDPVSPMALLAAAHEDLLQYSSVERQAGRVTAVTGDVDAGFQVTVEGAGKVSARRLVLASGVIDTFPEIDNFYEHYGTSVFHCPSCDGFET